MKHAIVNFEVGFTISSAETAGLPAHTATEGVVEAVHVAQPNRFLRDDWISFVNFWLMRFIISCEKKK